MMMPNSDQGSFLNVEQYPLNLLRVDDDGVHVPVTYKKAWDDGFGARGWKVDATLGDPVIIASTRETGKRINTSVFIHDILDHFLSGFGVSGHRSEAMALVQLSKRTGSDPEPDYEQLIKEDILNGSVNGEKLMEFLPADLHALIPANSTMTDLETIEFLRDKTGIESLMKSLVDHFFKLGQEGEDHADNSWSMLGLDTSKRTEIGLALQRLLEVVDHTVEQLETEELHGMVNINDKYVTFTMRGNSVIDLIEDCRVVVA